jgi:hypothetical protein
MSERTAAIPAPDPASPVANTPSPIRAFRRTCPPLAAPPDAAAGFAAASAPPDWEAGGCAESSAAAAGPPTGSSRPLEPPDATPCNARGVPTPSSSVLGVENSSDGSRDSAPSGGRKPQSGSSACAAAPMVTTGGGCSDRPGSSADRRPEPDAPPGLVARPDVASPSALCGADTLRAARAAPPLAKSPAASEVLRLLSRYREYSAGQGTGKRDPNAQQLQDCGADEVRSAWSVRARRPGSGRDGWAGAGRRVVASPSSAYSAGSAASSSNIATGSLWDSTPRQAHITCEPVTKLVLVQALLALPGGKRRHLLEARFGSKPLAAHLVQLLRTEGQEVNSLLCSGSSEGGVTGKLKPPAPPRPCPAAPPPLLSALVLGPGCSASVPSGRRLQSGKRQTC